MPELYGGVFGVRFDRQQTMVVVFKNSLRQIFRVSNIESARRFAAEDVRERGHCGLGATVRGVRRSWVDDARTKREILPARAYNACG